jgi:uncharacterized membrane protein
MKLSEVVIPKEIILLITFCVVLNMLRVELFGTTSLLYLLWNMFLAFIPFLVSSALLWHVHHANVTKAEIVFGGMFWLLLFPNAPYVITDLTHLGESALVPMWFDILLLFSCAWVGLEFAFHSLLQIEGLLRRFVSELHVQLILLPVLWFSGLGIYLGRELRFNSWDVIAAPQRLLGEIVDIFLMRSYFPEAFYFTMLFFAFMWVTYTAWKLKLGVLVIPQRTAK